MCSEQVIASIIDDSRCGMSNVAFRTAPTNWWVFMYKFFFIKITNHAPAHDSNHDFKLFDLKSDQTLFVFVGEFSIFNDTNSDVFA